MIMNHTKKLSTCSKAMKKKETQTMDVSLFEETK